MLKTSFFFAFICIIISNRALAQTNLKFDIFDFKNQPLKNGSIAIFNKENELIQFVNLDSNTNIILTILNNKTDALYFEINCNNFLAYYDTLTPCIGNFYKKIYLIPIGQIADTNSIVVTNQKKVWVSGDTTFFRTDAFKRGGEQKLSDVLQGIPGFKVKEDGAVWYKNKEIKFVKIDGNELLLNDISTMVKNLPSHVIENIQVIENFNSNTFLQNKIKGKELLLNIKTKQKYSTSIFGDVLVGLGTQSRKLLSPNIISLLPKAKFISFNSFSQNGIVASQQGFSQQMLKPSYILYNGNNPNSLFKIPPNFALQKVVPSKYFASKSQINLNLKNRPPIQVLFNYLTSLNNQFTNNSESILTTAGILSRSTQNNIVLNNTAYSLGLKHSLAKEGKYNFIYGLAFALDKYKLDQLENFITNISDTLKVNSQPNIRRRAISFNSQFTKSISPFKFLNVNLDIFYGQYNAKNSAYNNTFPTLFGSNSNDTVVTLVSKPKELNAQILVNFLKANNQTSTNVMYYYKFTQISAQNNVYVPSSNLANFNYITNKQFLTINNIGLQSFSVFNKKQLNFKQKSSFGVIVSGANGGFYLNTEIIKTLKLIKVLKPQIVFGYNRDLLTSNLTQKLQMVNFTNFSILKNPFKPVNVLKFGSSFIFKKIFFDLSYNKDFNIINTNSDVKANYFFTYDSITNLAGNSFALNASYSKANIKKGENLIIGLYSSFENKFFNQLKINQLVNNLSISKVANIAKRLFLDLELDISQNINLNNFKIIGFANYNNIVKIAMRYYLQKKYSIGLQNKLINTRRFDGIVSNFYLLDATFTIPISKKLILNGSVDNLTNYKLYKYSYQNSFYSSQNNIPILPRNIFVKISFNF